MALQIACWPATSGLRGRYRRILRGFGHAVRLLEGLYDRIRPYAGRYLDPFGFEFFMCAAKA